LLDAYAGVWFFTANPEFWSDNSFFPGIRTQTEAPVGSFEGHLSYNVKPRLWVSLDGNFWFGGRTTVNSTENVNTYQKNSRVGATASIRVTKHQSLKISYNNGDYVLYGGNYQSVSVAWQYKLVGETQIDVASAGLRAGSDQRPQKFVRMKSRFPRADQWGVNG